MQRKMDVTDIVHAMPDTGKLSEAERNELKKIYENSMKQGEEFARFFQKYREVKHLMRDLLMTVVGYFQENKLSPRSAKFEAKIEHETLLILLEEALFSSDEKEFEPGEGQIDSHTVSFLTPYVALLEEYPQFMKIVQESDGISALLMKVWRFVFEAYKCGDIRKGCKFMVRTQIMENKDVYFVVTWR